MNILEQLQAVTPALQATVPYVGAVDLTPLLLAFGVFIVLNVGFRLLQQVVVVRLQALSVRTSTDIDDVVINAIAGIRGWIVSLVSVYLALQLFALPETVQQILAGVTLVAIAWQAIEIAVRFIDYGTKRFLATDEDGDGVVDPGAATASNMVSLLARITLWVLGLLFVLSNLGIEVTSLIAGLGIGGIAVAFALQGILSDLFASFSIYFDRPFRIGDFIVIGSDSGTVEKIGIKSTRIRTLQGEELVVSNAELTTARVQNFKKMQERRIVTQFGVTYETPSEKLRSIPTLVTTIFKELAGGRLDRVHFTTFGDSALIFEVVYFIESSDYTEYLTVQQQFNFALLERFTAEGIAFAYPTQTIYHTAVS